MKTSVLRLLTVLSVLAPVACVNQEPLPEGERHHDDAEKNVSMEDIRDLPSTGGFRQLPPLVVGEPAGRVAFLLSLDDVVTDVTAQIEVRGHGAGQSGEWMPVDTVFAEENLRVAVVDLDLFADIVDVRLTEAVANTVLDMTFSAVPPNLEELENPFELEEAAEQESGLAAELADIGVISRQAWGARPSGNCYSEYPKARMAIHHTAGWRSSSGSYFALVKALESYARDGLGYCEMHYHFLVAENGQVFEARPLHYRGSHSGGYNTHNIGISLMGCFDDTSYCSGKGGRDVPTAMFQATAKLMRRLSQMYGIAINEANIKGHGQQPGQNTGCPGNHMRPRMEELRQLAKQNPVQTPPPSTQMIFDLNGYLPTGAGFKATNPARLLDTRSANSVHNGKLAHQQTINIPVLGRAGVPSSGVSAVVLNVTVTQPTANGFMAIYPSGASFPNTSSLNFSTNQTTANLVFAKPGSNGKIALRHVGGQSHAIIDVFGYFNNNADFVVLTPSRVIDTRNGAVGPINGKITGSKDIQLGGKGGVPSSGVAAVIVNLTSVDPEGPGHAVFYKAGTAKPNTSNLNYAQGQVKANTVIVPVSSAGKATLYTHAKSHYVIDIYGYVPTNGTYKPVNAARVHDSRNNNDPIETGTTRDLTVLGVFGVPASGVEAVFGNLTVTQPTNNGHLRAYASGASLPATSNLNFTGGETVPNGVVVKPGSNGKIRIHATVAQ